MTIGDDSTVEVVEDGAGSIDDSTRQQQSQPLHHGEEDRMMMIHQKYDEDDMTEVDDVMTNHQ